LFSSEKALLSTKKTAHNPLLRLFFGDFLLASKESHEKPPPFAEAIPLLINQKQNPFAETPPLLTKQTQKTNTPLLTKQTQKTNTPSSPCIQ